MVDTKTKQGSTPLHEAAYYGRADAIKVLLAHKADVNARDNNKVTPLVLATLGRTLAERLQKTADVERMTAVEMLLREHGATR